MKKFVKTLLITITSIGISVIVIGVADLFSDSDFFIGWMGGGFFAIAFFLFSSKWDNKSKNKQQ